MYGNLDGARAIGPAVTSGTNLGDASKRFYQAYFAVAADVSSDAKLKPDAQDIPVEWVRAARSVKPKRYHLTTDGPDAKWRFGYIAQDIIAAFEAEGCDVFETNIISNGADGMYGVNYTEFEALRDA
ncbi:tail fiber domain-containing protein [Mesorhizobium sp. NPDC059054]|uniref:tail fiber domain-containing protein n=1 Tax=Mesorhizobium sp. NPDC059054 TaxID=3346711 RepID=UPI003678302C